MMIDKDVKRIRILNNLEVWEQQMTKYQGLPYNNKLASLIKTSKTPFRLIINRGDPVLNEKKAYSITKHLINAGISPSKVCIVNIEDCYLSVRGFGDMAKVKERIFKDSNEVIIIEGLREIRATDVKDNVYSFWQEFWAYIRKNRNLHILFCFDTTNDKDWYPRETNKSPHRELQFAYS